MSDIVTLIADLHRRDLKPRMWMPHIFDETFSQPGFMWHGHVQGTNCAEYRCMECGLWAVVPEGWAIRPCTHIASDEDYDG